MPDDVQRERLDLAGIQMTAKELKDYLAMPDTLPVTPGVTIPKGYKRCSKCGVIAKLHLFNKNGQAKDNCTTQCKECQKQNAHKSYDNNRHKRNYKKYYQENKEAKQAQSRQYYITHKAEMQVKHAQYRTTSKGKKAMSRAHKKRAKLLKENAGIPYTREILVERDSQGGEVPICYLCGEPITGALQLDHVIPVAMGGKDCFTNIACVHDTCNLRKSKDGREITTEQVETINSLSEEYMEAHQELFPEIFAVADAEAEQTPDTFEAET